MSTTTKSALIIGCGIAGPVAAIGLQRAGWAPVIYEGWPAPRDEAGSFLGLASNGSAGLDTLGIKHEVDPVGVPTTSLAFFNHTGKQLGVNTQPVMTFKRGLLTARLRDAAIARGIPIKWNKRLTGLQHTEHNTVITHFDDGTQAEGDMLLGCDGVHSRTRRAVFGDTPQPTYTGIISSGSYAHQPSMPSTNGVMRMTFGLHGFFSYQVLEGGEVYWFNNLFEPVEPAQRDLDAVPDEQWQHTLLDVHRSDHTPINEIIRATEHRIVRYGVYEMPVLPTWHKDRVCLVGDAAHAMGPHTGQGAAMALEDAVVLAKCLRDIDDVERAFAAYQRIRKQRVDFVVRQTRRTGNTKKPPGAWGRWMRDLVLPVFLKHGVNTFTPIYNHRIGWNEPVA